MEDIYLKNIGHEWHSEKVDLESYFRSFSEAYRNIMKRNNTSLFTIFESIVGGDDSGAGKRERANFIEDMSELSKKFKTTLPNVNILKKEKNRPLIEEKPIASEKSNSENVQFKKTNQVNYKSNERAYNAGNRRVLQEIQNYQEQSGFSEQKCVKEKVKEIYKNNTRNLPLTKPSLNILKFRTLSTMKQAKYKNSILTARSELLLTQEIDKNSKKNLKRGHHFLVAVRIHKPFTHRGEKGKVENLQQEILILGHQTLIELRDKIVCQSDFQDVRGDVSHEPDSLVTQLSREKYTSAMFYFDNTFYIDERGDQDYSEVVRRWALPRGINVGVTRNMGTTRVSDLRVRLGYPYIYMHQGGCEHLVILSDARLLTSKDSLDSGDYPLISRIPRPVTKYCFTCLRMPAKWIVFRCERLPKDIAFMCQKCLKSYNYVDGKKIGNFKAYRYFQKNSLL